MTRTKIRKCIHMRRLFWLIRYHATSSPGFKYARLAREPPICPAAIALKVLLLRTKLHCAPLFSARNIRRTVEGKKNPLRPLWRGVWREEGGGGLLKSFGAGWQFVWLCFLRASAFFLRGDWKPALSALVKSPRSEFIIPGVFLIRQRRTLALAMQSGLQLSLFAVDYVEK